MKVLAVMLTENVLTVNPETPLRELARVLYHQRLSGVPVVDEQGRCVGVVSEKDFFRALYPSFEEYHRHPESFLSFEQLEERVPEVAGLKVGDVMAKKPTVVHPDTPVMEAGAIMLARHHHRLPVVERDSAKFLGVVSRGDLYRAVLQRYLQTE